MKSIKETNQAIRDLMDPSRNGTPEILKQNLYHPENPSDGNFVIAYRNHVNRVKRALETNAAGAIAAQAALKAMNPGPVGTGKLVNPLFPFGAPPGSSGIMPDSADVTNIGEPLVEVAIRQDIHKKNSILQSKNSEQFNLYSDKNTVADNFYIDTELLQDQGVAGTKVEQLNGVSFNVPDYSRLFTERNVGFDFGTGEKGYKSFKPKKESRGVKDSTYTKRTSALDNADAFFSPTELQNGYVGPDEFGSIGIEDSTNYIPFFFEDMRMAPGNKRRIYFRAFLSSLRESFAPSWTKEEFFGRVEPVGAYKGTSRTVSLSFIIVAMSYAGFTVMWKKVNQFVKLLYPTFRNGVMVKAPVTRMRVGDLISDSEGNGLPGYISSIDFDYTESPWEITEWLGYSPTVEPGKAPQLIKVNLSFEVIHQTTPKLDEFGNFDTTNFRRIGSLAETQESPTDAESSNFSEDQ
jgi:hypothetical protein